MSTERICAALGVSAWPPDHYAILGLAPGPVDPAEVERRAVERTERLRAYQLAEPDAATDALNRVAQALVCLTDAAARRTYDQSLRPAAPPARPVIPIAQPAPTRPAPPAPPRPADPRREAYRALSAVRRLRAAWTRLGPLLLDAPARSLDLRASADLLRQLWLVRTLAARDDLPPLAGDVILSLARRPRVLRTVRAFGDRDRERVAADWHASAARIERHFQELSARVRRPHRRGRRVLARRLRAYALDWLLVLLGVLAIGVALVRTFL